MHFDDYQDLASETAVYPGIGTYPTGVMYATLGLTGEAGEVAEQVKKTWRNEGELTAKRQVKIEDEMGDVLWYVAQLATELGTNLDLIALRNLEKLRERASKDEIRYHD